jgi:uncharacterized protein DUF4384
MMHGRWFAPAATHICCVVLAAGCVLMGGGGQPTRSWEFGQYQRLGPEQIEPETSWPVSGGAGSGWVTLSRVAVQRPQIAPGGAVRLIVEHYWFTLGLFAQDITVDLSNAIRFEGQQVATVKRAVSLPRGRGGSSLTLKVPPDAAPGFYSVTTAMEPPTGTGVVIKSATSVFRVATAVSTTPAEFRLWTEKTSYKIGQTLRMLFSSSRDGYVTLIHVGRSGKATILYPNEFSRSNAVKAGHTYSVPPADFSSTVPYELQLRGRAGVELVYGLFTVEPTRFVEESFVQSNPAGPLNDNKAEAITRDINLVVKKIPLEEQASAVLEIEVTQ